MIIKIFSKLASFVFMSLVILGLVLGLRGLPGNIASQDFSDLKWTSEGPFELSPERGRFALAYSIIEEGTFHFSLPVADFATPDLGYKNGKYVSLFAPAISFIVIPGYVIGKFFNLSQVGAFAMISVFAFLNFLLIRKISIQLGAHKLASNLAGLTFLFATPGFAYAVSIYQHHVSTFLVLMSLYLLLKSKGWVSTSLIWVLCAAAIPIDYPNLFFLFPIGLYAFSRLISLKIQEYKVDIQINFKRFFTLLAMVPPLLFFFWFNKVSYGSPTQFSGTVTQVKEIGPDGLPAVNQSGTRSKEDLAKAGSEQRSAVLFFRTRSTLNGLFELWISSDRGVLFFTPVVLLGILGIVALYKKNSSISVLFFSIIAGNVALYSMWGDVYGGWAFGSRYLIPTYSILAIGLGVLLSMFRRNIFVSIMFLILFGYSLWVGALGAITSSRNPPKVEVLGLEQLTGREEKYTWMRNWQYLTEGAGSKSIVFQALLKDLVTPLQYLLIIVSPIFATALINLVILRFKK